MTTTAVLSLHCPDQAGIVLQVASFIYEHGGNIIDAQQHTEPLDKRFFMWVHFDIPAEAETHTTLRKNLAKLADRFSMHARLHFAQSRKRMAILVSGYDHCLYDLFLRHKYGEIAADIVLVASNHATLAPVAAQFGVPFAHVPVEPGKKDLAETRLLALLEEVQVDFLVLARYMQILTPILVRPFTHRIINVHHGFLPAFKGAKPYHQAYEHGVKLIGATSHYVTEELDMGPIIAQETARVTHANSVEDLVALGRDLEKQVLASAVKAHAMDKIMVYNRRTIVFRD